MLINELAEVEIIILQFRQGNIPDRGDNMVHEYWNTLEPDFVQ